MGTYDKGHGRAEMLKARPGVKPTWANDMVTMFVSGGGGEQTQAHRLPADRYYVLCLVESSTELIVLPDLVLDGWSMSLVIP